MSSLTCNVFLFACSSLIFNMLHQYLPDFTQDHSSRSRLSSIHPSQTPFSPLKNNTTLTKRMNSTSNIKESANMSAKERRQANQQRRHRRSQEKVQAANSRLALQARAASLSLNMTLSEPSPLRRQALKNQLRRSRSSQEDENLPKQDKNENGSGMSNNCADQIPPKRSQGDEKKNGNDMEISCADLVPQQYRLPPITRPQPRLLPPLKTIFPTTSTFEELSSPSRDPQVLTSFWSSLPSTSSESPSSSSSSLSSLAPLKASPTTSFTYPSVSSPTYFSKRDPQAAFANLDLIASRQLTNSSTLSPETQCAVQPDDPWGYALSGSSVGKVGMDVIREEDEAEDIGYEGVDAEMEDLSQ